MIPLRRDPAIENTTRNNTTIVSTPFILTDVRLGLGDLICCHCKKFVRCVYLCGYTILPQAV